MNNKLCLCPDPRHPAGGCTCMLTCTCRINDNKRNHSQPTTHLSAFALGTTHRLRAQSHTAETYKSRSTDKNEWSNFSLTRVYLFFCSIMYMHEYTNIHSTARKGKLFEIIEITVTEDTNLSSKVIFRGIIICCYHAKRSISPEALFFTQSFSTI